MQKLLLLSILIGALFGAVKVNAQSVTQGLYQTCNLTTAQGQAIAGAKVYFLTQPANTTTLTPLATVYNGSLSTASIITQPILTNQFGFCSGYLVPGIYTVCYVSQYIGKQCFKDQNVEIGGTSGSSFTLNTLSGDVTLAVGAGLSINTVGQTITINISTPFAITSFTGCNGALEVGQSIVNPTCTATYSGTPTSASITNTDSIDSPLTLITPFTSGTIVGTFHHTSVAATTVTITAIGSSTQTATQSYTWKQRIFGGVGASGATSIVTASGTTAVLSTTDTLPSAGLGAETVGESFGPYTPSGQNIYLLLLGGSHTFTDAGTGFPFAFNAPTTVTFTNEFGVTLTMYLYQSTNPLFGTYTPRVTN